MCICLALNHIPDPSQSACPAAFIRLWIAVCLLRLCSIHRQVSKKYSEMEELYCRLAARYPTVPLPAMPRKALFVGETEIRERRAAFDELVKFLSRHRTLATCPELLGFLGNVSNHRSQERVQDRQTKTGAFLTLPSIVSLHLSFSCD